MTDRWRISAVFHSAVALEGRERAAFLREACASDEALRREVESLLAHERTAERFLEQAALPCDALHDVVVSTLTLNQQLGPYQIIAPLGAGGMGEVYRAHDTKLGRQVAIKILPAQFMADKRRRARFAREARVLATLNHPHIGAIYGLEEGDGITALVLELVEGPTLAERLAQGPLPVAQALSIARQIADALDYAHERGIVHRDLKPANIVLQGPRTMTGSEAQAKVLDFGLAKSMLLEDVARLVNEPSGLVGGTSDGWVLGTPTYMSPEQVRGLAVDKRSDIWAFGCLLFEMLTGKRSFDGSTAADTFARILEHEPDWAALPVDMPRSTRVLLEGCLRKDPSKRVRDLAHSSFEVGHSVHSAPGSAAKAMQSGSPTFDAEPSRSWRRVGPWAAALLLMIFVAVGWGVWNKHIVERTLRVPIEYRNIPRQLEMTGDPPPWADVRLRGSFGLLGRLESRDIVAVLDLTNVRPGSRMFQLRSGEVRAPDGVEVAEVVPGTIALDFVTSGRRTVPIVPALDGEPAPGFVIGGVTSDPPTVEVFGPNSRLKQLTGATTGPVDITGSHGHVREVVAVGVTDSALRLAQPLNATVTVDVLAPVEREFFGVLVRWRNLGTGLLAQVRPTLTRVNARGRRGALADLRAADMNAFVDLGGLGVGQYSLQVQIDPSESYRVSKTTPSVVIVTIK